MNGTAEGYVALVKKLEIYEMGDPFPIQIHARDGKVKVFIANQLALLTKEEAEEAICALENAIRELPRSGSLCRIPEHLPRSDAIPS